MIKSIQVFCGSSKGSNPVYTKATKLLGQLLVKHDITLVYGAGNVGLMGIIADEVLENEGKAIGVIPDFLVKWEVCHGGLTDLHIVKSMDERKIKMAQLSDATIVLPGGYGTLDELFEILTLVQLRQLEQPVGILNVNGYYDHLLAHFSKMYEENFLKDIHRDMVITSDNPRELLAKMAEHKPIGSVGKWWNKK